MDEHGASPWLLLLQLSSLQLSWFHGLRCGTCSLGFLPVLAINSPHALPAAGVDYLHTSGLIHGDLKTANVLLRSTGTDSRGFTCKVRAPRSP
jgi:serine/threonine protein kinase